MSAQTLTEPDKIETELMRLWNDISKEKTRACLFNLIVFAEHSERMDYIRDIANKVSEKYPCRVLFISSDPKGVPYLKTAVSVVGAGSVACDYIDIGVGGNELERVPFVLLPHLIPDLPVSLLWAENPNIDHPLFLPLLKLSGRVIFDSESADSLLTFSKRVLALKEKTGIPIADLNWARTAGWRHLLASVFHDPAELQAITKLGIVYNDRTTPSFYHVKVQAFYLLAWLCNQLGWQFEKASQKLDFFFTGKTANLSPQSWEALGPGAIISLQIETSTGKEHTCARIPKQEHHVLIQSANRETCDLPYQFVLGKTIVGQSLVKEIVTKGTSEHYLATLEALSRIDRDRLC